MALSSSIYIYTDAALVLDASARVAEVAESGLVDVHVCVASTTMHGLQVSHQQCCVGSACMVDDAMQVHSKCRSMRSLPAAAATRVDASSTSAASVYSC